MNVATTGKKCSVKSGEYTTGKVSEQKQILWQLVAELRVNNDEHVDTLENEDEQMNC